MEQLLLKPTEVARALGMGRSKIYQMLIRRELPVVRIGRSVRVPVDELRQWLRQRISTPE